MYSPLYEPGPVVRSRLATPLRGVLRAVNTVMAAAALAIIGFSVYMSWQYHRHGLLPPAPEPPKPELRHPESSKPLGGLRERRSLGAFHAAPKGDAPWPIYSVGGAGVYLLATSMAGTPSSSHGSPRRRLLLYIVLLTCAILVEAALLLLIFTDNPWRKRIPPDPSGWWDAAVKYIDANARLVKVSGLAVLLAQLVTLGAACWLQGIYQNSYDAWLDDVEERQRRVREMLGRSAERAAASGGAGTAWGARMRERYGVESREWEAEGERARQTAVLAG